MSRLFDKPITSEKELAQYIAKRHGEHIKEVLSFFVKRLDEVKENELKENPTRKNPRCLTRKYSSVTGAYLLHNDMEEFIVATEQLFYLFRCEASSGSDIIYPTETIPDSIKVLQDFDERIQKILNEFWTNDDKPLEKPITNSRELSRYIVERHHELMRYNLDYATKKFDEIKKEAKEALKEEIPPDVLANKKHPYISKLEWKHTSALNLSCKISGYAHCMEYRFFMLRHEGLVEPYTDTFASRIGDDIKDLRKLEEKVGKFGEALKKICQKRENNDEQTT